MHSLKYGFLIGACALALSACGDPEKSAGTALEKVDAAWKESAGDLDPVKRLKGFDAAISDAEAVEKKYAKTSYGEALAAGRAAGGVSLTEMKQKRDAFAARAECYANPSADCLRAFGSRGGAPASSGDSSNAFADAERLVCEKDFKAADKALEDFKINKPAYAQELIQVALAASGCDKPKDTKAAIEAYLAAEPAQGPERVNQLLSIISTDALEPGWESATTELETLLSSGTLPANLAANVVLTLAIRYADMGDAKMALEKYSYFTDALHYQADWSSTMKLASGLILAGEADRGMNIGVQPNNPSSATIIIHEAAAELARRMGLIDLGGAALPNSKISLMKQGDGVDEFFAPVDASEKARDEKAADAVEAKLDEMAGGASLQNQAIGLVGYDQAYGLVALVRQKLGQSDKAAAAIKKGEDLRARILGSADSPNGYENFAAFETLIALAQDNPSAAAGYAAKAGLRLYNYPERILEKAGRSGDAEKALAVYGQLNGLVDDYHAFAAIMSGMSKAGKTGDIEKLIAAYPGNPAQKADFYWTVVDSMIASGDASGAKAYAEKHDLAKDERGKLGLDARLMNSEKIAGNRGKAEPIIREMFDIGEAMDKASSGDGNSYGRSDSYVAENAAMLAFKNGYTDLGVELYQKATNKDQRPLLFAFVDGMKKSDMTRVLMLAQDNLSGDRLGYVIDAAVRSFDKS